jgi:hypothetical protein
MVDAFSTIPVARNNNIDPFLQYREYVNGMSTIDHRRIKFCGEKSVKGQDHFPGPPGHRKVRCCLLTGHVPTLPPDSFYRTVTHATVFAIAGIDFSTAPVDHFISHGELVDDPLRFSATIECAIAKGSLKHGNVLVVGNNVKFKRYLKIGSSRKMGLSSSTCRHGQMS